MFFYGLALGLFIGGVLSAWVAVDAWHEAQTARRASGRGHVQSGNGEQGA